MSGFCIANRRSLTARSVLHRPVCQSEKRQTRISMRTLARKSHAVKPLTIFSVRQISLPNQVYRMCADCWQRFRWHHDLFRNHSCDSRFYSYLIFTREAGLGNCWFSQVLARNVPCITRDLNIATSQVGSLQQQKTNRLSPNVHAQLRRMHYRLTSETVIRP
jgi:hypothetical protein